MRHISVSLGWAHIDAIDMDFASEPWNPKLFLSSDGLQPHGEKSSTYSMWHVVAQIKKSTSLASHKEIFYCFCFEFAWER